MKLSDVFSQLTYGELKQMSLGGATQGGIDESKYNEVVSHINLALLNVYTRFPIMTKELCIRTREDQTVYELTTAHAMSVDPVDGYIEDSVIKPFTGDILRIQTARDETGAELAINDENADKALFTNSYNSIRYTDPTAGGALILTYRAAPAPITVPTQPADLDTSQIVEIPDVLLEPLLVYIEYRVHKARGGEAGLAQARAAKQHYEMLCADIDKRNILRNANNVSNIKPLQGGWV